MTGRREQREQRNKDTTSNDRATVEEGRAKGTKGTTIWLQRGCCRHPSPNPPTNQPQTTPLPLQTHTPPRPPNTPTSRPHQAKNSFDPQCHQEFPRRRMLSARSGTYPPPFLEPFLGRISCKIRPRKTFPFHPMRNATTFVANPTANPMRNATSLRENRRFQLRENRISGANPPLGAGCERVENVLFHRLR